MKLIGSTSSPYVRKVRVVMAEKKLDYAFVTDNVWGADTNISESNPLGKVPCLIMEGAEALFDSRVIVEYLDTLSPVGKLIPTVGRERAEVKTWEALADGVLDAAIHMSLADIAVGCALGYLEFRFPEIAWRVDYPNLAKLQDKLMLRPSFMDTIPA